ncbi:hypothetical protein LZ480_03920 [Solibacillus sp. MA9]|uniref:DegT/DnrJ/EryC1/StrS aminotransferase family protein n=1 Tax=Solibacillus palustris TaxID=2908203 RepID=A0ABS9U9M1_9BACL|nr:hypothetical protein [Solibacillus sp. MA9]MCH7321029.1 hypothetical protein [Solibacillus sp. MA9]
MKEIGGYFELEQLISNEYYKDLIHLNTARNALLYLIKSKKIEKVYIPFYLCNSVSNMLDRYGYEYEYYRIAADFSPIFNKELKKQECLYVVNYFGQLSEEKILYIKDKHKQIIVDNTQAFFQRPLNSVDTIYSCRKFFGVPDGAYLSTDKRLDKTLEIDISKDRVEHLLGRFEGKASDYYSGFLEVDERFNGETLKQMSKITRNLMGAIDYQNVIRERNRNYRYLENELKKYNPIKLNSPEGPYCYPFYADNGFEIRRNLAEKKIYIPTLWKNVLQVTPQESIEYRYSANLLPIPCDQRYDEDDMKYIVECINIEEKINY